MKTFFEVWCVFSSLCGAIVGAGFLSGAEPVIFFGTENFVAPLLFAAALFALSLGFLFAYERNAESGNSLSAADNTALKNGNGLKRAEKGVFGERKKGDGFFTAAAYIADFVFLSGMIAGLDACAENINEAARGFPVVSLLSLLFAFFYCAKGGGGLEKINLVLSPLSVFIVNAFIVYAFVRARAGGAQITAAVGNLAADGAVGATLPSGVTPSAGVNGVSVLNGAAGATQSASGAVVTAGAFFAAASRAVLYVFMNVFAAAPAVKYVIKGKSKKTLALSAVAFGAFSFVQTAAILLVVRVSGGSSSAVPIISAFSGLKGSFLVRFAVFTGIFTSFYSFFLPVYDGAIKKAGKKAGFWVIAAAFALSRVGFDKVIAYLYPIVGAFGGAYFIKTAKYSLVKRGIKKRVKTDNIDVNLKKEFNMSKKKKNKVKKLTEEEYGKYLMALKDEVPPKAVRDLQE